MNFRTTVILIVLLAGIGGYLYFSSSPTAAPKPAIEKKNPQQLVALSNGREVRTFSGLTGLVTGVALSPDGTQALSTSGLKTLTKWDVASGQSIQTLSGPADACSCVAYSPDGKTALTGEMTGGVQLWDLTSGQVLQRMNGHTGAVTSVAFSPDGKTAISAGDDKTLILWDLSSGKSIRTLTGHTDRVNSVAFSPDGKTVLSASADKTVKLWDVGSGQVLKTLTGHTDKVNAVAFCPPDGSMALSAGDDKTLILWNVGTGQIVRTLTGDSAAVICLSISTDGHLALSGDGGGQVKLWDLSAGAQLRNFAAHSGPVGGVAFSFDGRTAISGGADSMLKLWDIAGDVSQISITKDDGSVIALQRTLPAAAAAIRPADSTWEMTQPIQAMADSTTADGILDGLISATSSAQVDIGNNLAAYGLDHPQYTITFTTTVGGKTQTISIGRQVGQLYARVNQDNVAQVISADLLDTIDTTADKLRLTKLLDVDADQIVSVDISRDSQPLTLTKNDGKWVMAEPATRPTTRPADGPLTSDLITAIGGLTADSFPGADADASRLIGAPAATVTIAKYAGLTTQPTGGTATIEFSKPDALGKDVWVRIMPQNIVAAVTKESVDAILKSPLDLMDRDLLKVDPADVTRIEIAKAGSAGDVVTVLQRRPKKVEAPPAANMVIPSTAPTTLPATQPAVPQTEWMLLLPKSADASDANVSSVLSQFNPLHVDKYLATPPSTRPAGAATEYTVMLTTTKGTVTVTFVDPGESTGEAVDGTYNGQSFELPRAVITAINADFSASAAPSSPPPGAP